MNKKVIAFILIIPLVFAAVTCSNNVTNEPFVEQSPELIAQSGEQEVNATEDDEESLVDGSSNQTAAESSEEPTCQISLSLNASDTFSDRQVDCAKAFDIDGVVEVNQEIGGDSAQGAWKNINELSNASEEILLNAQRNSVRTQKNSSARFLFNTLDLIATDADTQFGFEAGGSIKPGGGTIDKANLLMSLDFGKLMVSNAIPDNPFSDQANVSNEATVTSSSRVRNGSSESESFWASALRNSRVSNFFRAPRFSFIKRLTTQAAFAYDEEEIPFTSTTLQVKTPEATAVSGGAVYVVDRHPSRKETQVYSLSMRPVRVTDKFGQSIELRRNETVLVTRNGIQETKFEFPLCSTFYRRNSELLRGIPPKEETFVNLQPFPLQVGYHVARSMTLPLYHRNCQRTCPPRGS